MKRKLTSRRRAAFTIIELLVVIAIMAMIATLVTGAAIKSLRLSRRKRVDVMVRVLENGLVAYRTRENEWPFEPGQLTRAYDPTAREPVPIYRANGTDNYKVFEELLRKMVKDHILYVDPSALLVRGRKPLKDALKEGRFNLPFGYPDPNEPNNFKYFSVEYNQLTDSVKVLP